MNLDFGSATLVDDSGGFIVEHEHLVQYASKCSGVILLDLSTRSFSRSSWEDDRERRIHCFADSEMVAVAKALTKLKPVLLINGSSND